LAKTLLRARLTELAEDCHIATDTKPYHKLVDIFWGFWDFRSIFAEIRASQIFCFSPRQNLLFLIPNQK
jgi:hypothetical protein